MSDSKTDLGVEPSAPGLSPSVEPVPVSPADAASIPNAGEFIRKASNLYHASLAMEDPADREIFATKIEVTLRATADWLTAIASAMSARSGETEGLAPKDASAVPQADAPEFPA
jgi:hypothetical protein